MIVDLDRVEAFLTARLGSDVSDVAQLGKGVWSKAFAFRRAGGDYVVRFGAHKEDFAKGFDFREVFEERYVPEIPWGSA